jgi:hypothetical protein
MDTKSGRNNTTDELKERVTRSRQRFESNYRGLRDELDFPKKIRRSFREQTLLWVGAVAAVGVLISMLPARTKKVYVAPRVGGKSKHRLLEAGFVLGALKIAATLLRPVIVDLVRSRLLGSRPRPLPPKEW